MSTPLDKDLPLPLYHQLQGVLKAEIESGKWRTDEQLPNESKLAERFGVSKITVRQALQELSGLGYIRREQGRGTFIARRQFEEGPRELTGFTEEMRRHNLVAASRILDHRIVEANVRVAEALLLPAGSRVFVLKRLRLADGKPVTVQTAYIPAAFVPGIGMADGVSLYEVLQSRYDLYAAGAKETYSASAAGVRAAELLDIPEGSPVFAVERVTFLPNGKPFEFVQSIVRGDRYSIVLEVVKADCGTAAVAGAGIHSVGQWKLILKNTAARERVRGASAR
jgi:GntR family transcriptional regulator